MVQEPFNEPMIKFHKPKECKEAIPPLAIPGRGCATLGIPVAVTSVTVVTLVPLSLHSHYVGIRTIYIGPVYSCVTSLITPLHHSLQGMTAPLSWSWALAIL